MIKVHFDNPDVQINNVQGYRITARLNPNDGLQSEFYIYVASTFAGSDALQAVTFEEVAGPRNGTLRIAGQRRSYTVAPASLIRVQAGATRRERYQILEFQVSFQRDEQPQVTIENDDPVALQRLATLGDDYKIAVGSSDSEHLLGFTGFQTSRGTSLYRFSGLRNGLNSWVQSVLDWQSAIREGDEQHTLPVRFSQGTTFDLDRQRMNMLYVDESYGVCQRWNGLSLREIVAWREGAGQAPSARLPIWEYTIDDLVEHDNQARGEFAVPTVRRAVETATVVLNEGHYHNVAIK